MEARVQLVEPRARGHFGEEDEEDEEETGGGRGGGGALRPVAQRRLALLHGVARWNPRIAAALRALTAGTSFRMIRK